jgi:hypothetical protein
MDSIFLKDSSLKPRLAPEAKIMNTKPSLRKLAFAALLLATSVSQLTTARAQGTAFAYQGRLNDSGAPANGSYDLRFTIYDSTNLPGTVVAGPITNSATGVTNGLFAVSLDFGAGVFTGADRWVEIATRTNGPGAFAVLTPRQKIFPVPYAMYSGNAASSASYSGPVALSQLPPTVALLNSNQVFTGAVSFSNPSNSFAGSGAGLNGVPWTRLDGQGEVQTHDAAFILAAPIGPPNYYAGFIPWSLATADVNGDGKPDLIVADAFNLHTLNVLTNDGTGSFGLSSTLTLSSDAPQVVTADFNGDGKVDIACVNGSSLSVFTNDGSGHFTLSASPPGSVFVAAGDLNGDGRADLVTGNPNLTVLINNGAGNFVAAWSTNSSPVSVALADMNGDGKTDIVSVAGTSINVFTNKGDGTFALATSATVCPAGLLAEFVLTADVNGDGRPDAVVACQTNAYPPFGSMLTVLTNDGHGGLAMSFSTTGVLAFQYNATPLVAAADLDGDGRIDLVTANGFTNSVSVLHNTGNGTFAVSAPIVIDAPNAWTGPPAVAIADVNGDGRPDIFVVDPSIDVVTILTNTAAVTFQAPVNIVSGLNVTGAAVMSNPSNIFAGAFSGDGSGLTGLTFANFGTLPDAQLSSNVALRAGANTFGGGNTFNATTTFNSGVLVNPPANLSFGSATRQMLNLWNTNYGIGVQSLTTYFRTDGASLNNGFSWFKGGVHNDGANNPGGGVELMRLTSSTLTVNGTARVQGANNWDVSNTEGDFRVGNDTQRFKIGVATNGGGAGDVWMRAQGGTQRVFLETPGGTTIFTAESQANGVSLAAGSGAWTSVSDRNAKENFSPVNAGEILEKVASLPLTTWNYKTQEAVFRHLGPMAQDFKAAFGLGETDKGICTVDADGVALAAIQGLNQKLTEELKRRDAENAELNRRLTALEQIILKQKSN